MTIIESIVGARFSRVSCLFIQDDLYKQKGLVYIDKNDGLLYTCLKDGNTVNNTTDYFKRYKPDSYFDREFESGYVHMIPPEGGNVYRKIPPETTALIVLAESSNTSISNASGLMILNLTYSQTGVTGNDNIYLFQEKDEKSNRIHFTKMEESAPAIISVTAIFKKNKGQNLFLRTRASGIDVTALNHSYILYKD